MVDGGHGTHADAGTQEGGTAPTLAPKKGARQPRWHPRRGHGTLAGTQEGGTASSRQARKKALVRLNRAGNAQEGPQLVAQSSLAQPSL